MARQGGKSSGNLPAVLLAALALTASLLLSGCIKGGEGPRLETISIAFQSWPGYGLWYLARDKNFCRDEGVDLFIIDAEVDSERRDAMRLGMLDCEAGTIDLLVSKRAQGLGIVAVMELDESAGSDGIVVAEGIKSVEDLSGKRVAFAQDDVGDTFISYLLDKSGISRNRIEIVMTLPDGAAAAFLRKDADAVVTWQPQLKRALDRPGSRLLVTSKDEPGVIVDMLNVREDVIRSRPRAVKGMMRSWFRALKFYRENPEEACSIISRYYGISPEEYRKAVEGLVWKDYAAQDSDSERAGWFRTFDTIARIKFDNKRIPERPEAPPAFDLKPLKELYEDSR